MSQFNNTNQSSPAENDSVPVTVKQRKKTGPSPKYGPDQAKKMVSMRLSPDALNSIKRAAELVFQDSQADVVERMTRYFPAESLRRICDIAEELKIAPNDVLSASLDLYEAQKNSQLASV